MHVPLSYDIAVDDDVGYTGTHDRCWFGKL